MKKILIGLTFLMLGSFLARNCYTAEQSSYGLGLTNSANISNLQTKMDITISTDIGQWNSGYANQADIVKVEASTKIVTDNQANWTEGYTVVKTSGDDWSKQSAVVRSSIPTLSSHKATEDAINGIVKVNGSGSYSAATDNTSNWNMAVSSIPDLSEQARVVKSSINPMALAIAQLQYEVDTTTKTFDIEFATATVGEKVNVPFGSTGTVTDVYFTALVPPAGANFTMTISSTNYNGTINASMGTITILAGAYVSNVLTLNQVIARRSGLIFEVTGIGSTTAGFNIGGFIKYYKSRAGGN